MSNLYETIDDIIFNRKRAVSYDVLLDDEKRQVISALIQDMPEADSGELMYDPKKQFDLLTQISLFIKAKDESVSSATVLRDTWMRAIYSNYQKTIDATFWQVIDDRKLDPNCDYNYKNKLRFDWQRERKGVARDLNRAAY